jgi:membrane protease YdiL (CAAX protease family)
MESVMPGLTTATPQTLDRRPGPARLAARHPLGAFFAWFFTVGQTIAFIPILVHDLPVPRQVFIVGSTLIGLLLPAVVITRIVDGPAGLRAFWRRAVKVRVSLGWYAFALLVVPATATAITFVMLGPPADLSVLGPALAVNLLLPLLLTFAPNNWWEEVAWMGFVQARLQSRRGPVLAAVLTAPLFALQHISLTVGNPVPVAVLIMVLLAVLAVPFRFVTGWAYNRTGSLFLVGLVHGAGNAVAGGSGFQDGFLTRLYPGQQLPGLAHLLAFLVIGLIAVALTRGRLGLDRSPTP